MLPRSLPRIPSFFVKAVENGMLDVFDSGEDAAREEEGSGAIWFAVETVYLTLLSNAEGKLLGSRQSYVRTGRFE
jgi:hypothetical protein